MRIAVLEGRVSLCKTFRNMEKEPYPNVRDFKSSSCDIATIEQLHALIRDASLKGACLLKGELDRELNWEPRAGHTDSNKPTSWLCFDLDYLSSIGTIDDFLIKIGETDTSYILQWSASYGIHGNFFLRAHLFMLLDQPQVPAVLKVWLKQVNLLHFANDLTLTKTTTALRWGLDVTTCQSDKLLFVAPPRCYPPSINQFQGERVVLVKRAKDAMSLPASLKTVEQIKLMEQAKIDELRKAAGMEPRGARGFVLKELNGEEYRTKPDQALVTGVKTDGHFVRLNLNGGDSWAYYHTTEHPEVVRNFKGEPLYRTQELVPDYWYSLDKSKKQAVAQRNKGKLFLAFRDFRTAAYYNGWYDQDNDVLELNDALSEKRINDFLVDHGQPVPKAIPIWNLIYDPHAGTLDLGKRTVNLFQPSQYMKDALDRQDHQPFPTIDRICRHVMGSACVTHWYNWLAFMYQFRVAPGTAWVWHGVPGTGKGVLFSHVLEPLFGRHNTIEKRMEELEEKFNGHLERCMICFIDEAQVSESGRYKIIMSNLKNQITEPTITIRRMRTNSYSVTNYLGWIFASNMPDAVMISPDDRRFNVGEYQPRPIVLTEEDIANVHKELLDFAVFLRHYEVDRQQVRTVLKNAAREQLIMISRTSADIVASALLNGHMDQLWDMLPHGEPSASMSHGEQDAYYAYKKLVRDIIVEGRDRLTREELHIVFNFCVGNAPSNPSKLSSYLRHKGIEIKPIRVGNSTPRGIMIDWQDGPTWFADRRAELLQAENVQLKAVK